MSKPSLLVIVGPTAVGKTAMSLHLAERLAGEVVSADSRLFYRGMDIGTAKPTQEEQARVPHHLIDIADPDETIGLAQFIELTKEAIADIQSRARLPILVGGTGQYVRAVVEGWNPPRVLPDHELRASLEKEAEEFGPKALHAKLAAIDPDAAEQIDPRNVRRVVRALEVCMITGRSFSSQRQSTPPSYPILQIGLTMKRQELYARIDARIESMLRSGLEQEVRLLLERGYGWELPAMSGLGYIQLKPYLHGKVSLDEAVAEIKRATRSFVRRQYNWFRLSNPRIKWFDVTLHEPDQVMVFVDEWLQAL